MASYTKIVDYAAKDALITGNPAKVIKGTEIGAEFDAIVTADANNLKLDGSATVSANIPMNSKKLTGLGNATTSGDALHYGQTTASSGSSIVGFLPSGAGAVATTIQSKLRESVSVKDFGAVGDGTTNDTAAIQAALDSGAASIFLPKGVYKITTGLLIPNGVSIYGTGGTSSVISCLSCNGLNFRSASYDNGAMFYEDFGLLGHAGSTANWVAVESILPSGGTDGVDSRDGLHFSRIKIRDFDIAFKIAATWEWSVTHCKVSKVNQAFNLGTYTMVTRINNNMLSFEGGDSFSGTSAERGIYTAGVVEGLAVYGNQIYGFATDIHLHEALFVDITNNDLESSVYGIYLSTVTNGLNIKNNYIQVDGTAGVAAIRAPALGAEIQSQINIEGNNLIAAGTTSCYGIWLGTSAAINSYHYRIIGNLFSGFSAQDIYTDNPGKLVIENNRCLSTGNAASMRIDAVYDAPVIISNNECIGTIVYNAADLPDGKLILNNNIVSDTFTPYRGAWTPVLNGFTLGGAGTTVLTGTYHKVTNNLVYYTCLIDCTGTTTIASVANTSYISGLPFTSLGSPATVGVVNANTLASYGTGLISSTSIWTPVWTATAAADNIWISGYCTI